MSVYNIDGNSISGGNIYINVMDFGAVGDGSTSDSANIQSALQSCKDTGGTIYFPFGTYLITEPLLFYSNQTLLFDKGAVLLQGASIDSLLRTYSEDTWTGYNGVHDCVIYGATFDGSSYTTNNSLLGMVHAKNITVDNCTFKNAYGTWHNIEINGSYNIKISNCDLEGSRKTTDGAELIQIDSTSSGGYPWPNVNYDGTVCQYIEIDHCIFHNDTVSPAIGSHATASHSFIRIHDNIFDGFTLTSKGAINFQSVGNVDVYNNTFNGCTKGVAHGNSGDTTWVVHDNRFVGVTTAISMSGTAINNMINGTFVP